MRWDDSNLLPLIAVAREPDEPYGPGGDGGGAEPPRVELRPHTREGLWRIFRGGERECDELELRLVRAARSRGGLALRIGQELHALRKGRRLMELGFRFPDHCRELGIGRSRGYELCAFAEALETRGRTRRSRGSGWSRRWSRPSGSLRPARSPPVLRLRLAATKRSLTVPPWRSLRVNRTWQPHPRRSRSCSRGVPGW